MTKKETLLNILEILEDRMVESVDLLAAFLNAGHNVTYKNIQYQYDKLQREKAKRENDKLSKQLESKSKQKYYDCIYKLKRDGLIEEKTKENKKFFILTPLGKNKLKILKNKRKEEIPPSNYHKENSDKLTIIIFDIPEKERRKRDWLRSVLKNLGFQMVQKSVWLGKVKIPQQFLEDLNNLQIINYIEIFEITKTGSLKQTN